MIWWRHRSHELDCTLVCISGLCSAAGNKTSTLTRLEQWRGVTGSHNWNPIRRLIFRFSWFHNSPMSSFSGTSSVCLFALPCTVRTSSDMGSPLHPRKTFSSHQHHGPLFFLQLAKPRGLWDLSSPPTDRTHDPCGGSTESQTLDCQGSPGPSYTLPIWKDTSVSAFQARVLRSSLSGPLRLQAYSEISIYIQ